MPLWASLADYIFRRERCEKLIKYQDRSFEFKGVGVEIPGFKVSFEGFSTEPNDLQEATEAAKSLDDLQYLLCQDLRKRSVRELLDRDVLTRYTKARMSSLFLFSSFRAVLEAFKNDPEGERTSLKKSIEDIRKFTSSLTTEDLAAPEGLSPKGRDAISSALETAKVDEQELNNMLLDRFTEFEKDFEKLREDFRQNYGLVRLHDDYFKDYTEQEQDLKDWQRGFSFKLQSVKKNLEFRRTKIIDSIEKRLDHQGGVLIVGPRGSSKTTVFYEIICDYYDRGYEILYNEGDEIKDGYGLQRYIEELLKGGNRVLVAVDNTHTAQTAAIFFVMDRLLGLNYELKKNVKFILTARLPDLDRLIEDRLEQVQQIYQHPIRKLAGKDKEKDDDNEFRFSLPYFEPDEIKAFYRFYRVDSDKPDTIPNEQMLNIITNDILSKTNGHPILVKFLVLGHKLSNHVADIYMDHLKNDENKLKTMLVCGLFDISVIPITSDLLQKMRILTFAQDLEGITLRQEESVAGSLWKTFHSEWDVELLSFLYNNIKAGTELKLRSKFLEGAIKSIFDIMNEQITYSIMRSLYYIAADKRVPMDIVESLISKQMSNYYYLSKKTKCDLYTLVMAPAYSALEMYSKAIEKCKEALDIDQNFVPALNNEGAAHYSLGEDKEAINCFDKALELNPKYTSAWINKGLALLNVGKMPEENVGKKLEEAIVCYDKVIEIEPGNSNALYNKGSALFKLGRYEEAINCYDKVLEIDPADAFAWNSKGNALHNSGRYEEATNCFSKATDIDPDYAGDYIKPMLLASSHVSHLVKQSQKTRIMLAMI